MSKDNGPVRPPEKRNRGRGHWMIEGYHVVREYSDAGDLRWYIRNEYQGPNLDSGKTLAEVEELIRRRDNID